MVAVALAVVFAAGAHFVVIVALRDAVFGDEAAPSCDAPPVVVAWSEPAGQWRRSEVFELVDDSQTVQIDVGLGPDGGVFRPVRPCYVVAAGAPLPESGSEPSSMTPFASQRVGFGVNAVNEQITLDAGRWQLAIKGNVGTATVKWPC